MPSPLHLIVAGALILTAGTAFAALPPNYQRAAEFKAVADNPEVAGAFPVTAPMSRIEYLREDVYRVTGGRCHLDATIVTMPQPAGMVGPRRFEVRPGKLICARGKRR